MSAIVHLWEKQAALRQLDNMRRIQEDIKVWFPPRYVKDYVDLIQTCITNEITLLDLGAELGLGMQVQHDKAGYYFVDTENDCRVYAHQVTANFVGYRNEDAISILCSDCYQEQDTQIQTHLPVGILTGEARASGYCCDVCQQALA